MNRRQILQRLERGWRELHESLDGLSHEEMVEPVFDGGWSVKDLLGHVTTWEEEAIKAMDLMARGQPQPRYRQYRGIDGFNAWQSEKKAGLSLEDVQSQLMETHHMLMSVVAEMSEEHWATETRIRRRLRIDTYGHYRLHCEQIMAWRIETGS